MVDSTFKCRNGWFSMTLPKDWVEYADTDDFDTESDTYAFTNISTSFWSGNLRITPYRWADPESAVDDQAAEYIQGELDNNPRAVKIHIGKFTCAHYSEEDIEDGKLKVYYYWITGVRDILFMCSFTIDKEQKGTAFNQQQLESVQSALRSITIH